MTQVVSFLKDLDPPPPSPQTDTTKDITINIRIHVDTKLLESLKSTYEWKNDTQKKLAKILLKDAVELFSDPILHVHVNFNPLSESRLVVAQPFFYDGPLEKYYDAYCNWQGELKSQRRESYYSVLLTQRKVDDAYGYATRGGICHRLHSCTVIQWIPEKLDYLLAKSIGLRTDAAKCLKSGQPMISTDEASERVNVALK
ncbi:hypothetical protein JYU34_014095 [Plutella xylostella]|uniref:Uncharacterized protein n=1 Tax=Plutella xylostella TaxID=51655 RepID=A0ABQ7Q7J4_PLUXY|nr:hypothetical protein JYU34_014095 [Plutella xylostella]